VVDVTNLFPGGFKASAEPEKLPAVDPFREFLAVLQDSGFEISHVEPTADSPIRCKVSGSKDKPGWYHFKIFTTHSGVDIGFGNYGDWRDGISKSWDSKHDYSQADRVQIDQQREIMQANARKAKADANARAATEAQFLMEGLPLASDDHPYLVSKKVKVHGIHQTDHGQLIIPRHDSEGIIHSYQSISGSGKKLFQKDGRTIGTYYQIGEIRSKVYMAEGYATAATIHEITGEAVIVAFNAGNLKAALQELRTIYIGRVIICADNDSLKTNTGEIKAKEALDKNAIMLMPPNPGDFNDMYQANREECIEILAEKSADDFLMLPGDLSTEPPKWLIKNVIEANSMTLMVGAPGCGKSFLAIDLAMSIVRGVNWYGEMNKKKGAVVYICGEGQHGIERRLRAYSIQNRMEMAPDTPFIITRTSVQLLDQGEQAKIVGRIEKMLERLDMNCEMIVWDTLNRNFGAGDENSTSDMTKWVAAVDNIKNHLNCAALIVHHTGLKDGDRGRGSSSLKAASDNQIIVKGEIINDEKYVVMVGDRMKDADDVAEKRFKLAPIHLGTDEDGDDYKSLALQLDVTIGLVPNGIGSDLGKVQSEIYQCAVGVFNSIAVNLEKIGMDKKSSCGGHILLDEYRKKHPNYRKDHFDRSLSGLVEKGLLVKNGGDYSLIS
tara:strand:- start:59 stop:2053 length:1995 start_codon:yes stop_codon:yes gene_type:complete